MGVMRTFLPAWTKGPVVAQAPWDNPPLWVWPGLRTSQPPGRTRNFYNRPIWPCKPPGQLGLGMGVSEITEATQHEPKVPTKVDDLGGRFINTE